MADNQRYILDEVVGGMGGFGLLAGLCVTNLSNGYPHIRGN